MPFLLFLLVLVSLHGNDKAHTFADPKSCKGCHPIISQEFETSMHRHAAPFHDPIHKAVWDKHPKHLKAKQYTCGKCHTPAANNLDAMLNKGEQALPDATNKTHDAGITCAYCHRIESIKHHPKSNINIISTTPKVYFGTRETKGSPFHGVVTEGNEHMKNGNVCIGCHSHKRNKYELNVCSTNVENEMDRANCVSCHMPQKEGSVSTLRPTKTHAFHGFAGAQVNPEMLAHHIDLSIMTKTTLQVTIKNHASHALLLHPLRMAELRVEILRDGQRITLKPYQFMRVIGADGKPAMPWQAKEVLTNTMIQHNETRTLDFNFTPKKGDQIKAILGFYLVHPKAQKLLKLEDHPKASRFTILKEHSLRL